MFLRNTQYWRRAYVVWRPDMVLCASSGMVLCAHYGIEVLRPGMGVPAAIARFAACYERGTVPP
eukprot:423111-Rhodomonas_salina.1